MGKGPAGPPEAEQTARDIVRQAAADLAQLDPSTYTAHLLLVLSALAARVDRLYDELGL